MEGKLIDFSMDMVYQLLIQGASFLLFFVLVKVFFYDKINEILEKRKEAVNEDFESADRAREEAIRIQAEYENKLKDAKEEAILIKTKAKEEADNTKSEILKEANNEARSLKEKSKKDIKEAKENAMREVKDEIVGISLNMTEKILNEKIDKEADKELINSAIESLDEV